MKKTFARWLRVFANRIDPDRAPAIPSADLHALYQDWAARPVFSSTGLPRAPMPSRRPQGR
jgi:hypothetical protein